eukprot:1333303-Amphidinium_carterae.2
MSDVVNSSMSGSMDDALPSVALPEGIRKRLTQHVNMCQERRCAVSELRKGLPRILVRGFGIHHLVPCCELDVKWDHREDLTEDIKPQSVQEMCVLGTEECELVLLLVPKLFTEDQLKTACARCRVPVICAAATSTPDGRLLPTYACEERWLWCSESSLGSVLSSWCWKQPAQLLHALSLSLRVPELIQAQALSHDHVVECPVCQKMLQHFGKEPDAFTELSMYQECQGTFTKGLITKLLHDEIVSASKKIPLQRRSVTRDPGQERIRGLTFGYNVTRGRGINKTNENEQRLLKLVHALAVLRKSSEPYVGVQVNLMSPGHVIAPH